MTIKEIELHNFRIYKGVNRINLAIDGSKNMIVVSGKNGYGKTTFLMSLVWVLYGRQMEKVDELYQKEIVDKGGYTKYIANSLNRAARASGETKFSVSVIFSGIKIPDVTCNEIKITRAYDINNIEDHVEILIDGYHNELIAELGTDKLRGEEIFIRDFILPLEIAKFFFFDAEKIVSLAEINSPEQRRQLSLAYSEVLGIKKYEELRENLERKQDEYKKQSANAKEREAFNNLETIIKNNKIKIEEAEAQIDKLKEERNSNKFESNQIQEKLIREGNKMTVEELNILKDEEAALSAKIELLQESLKDSFDLIPFGLTGELMLDVSNQLEKESQFKNNKFKQDNVEDKTVEILNDLDNERVKAKMIIDTRIQEFYTKQFKYLVKKHFFADVIEIPNDFKTLHDFSETERNEFNSLISNLRSSFKNSFKRINVDYNLAKNEIRGIQVKIRDAEKNQENPLIASLKAKKDVLDIRNLTIDGIISQHDQEIGVFKNEIKTSEAQKTELSKKIEVSRKNKAIDDKHTVLVSEIKDFITSFKAEKKKSLENSILKGLKTLLHKKNFISKVLVDISVSGDDIDIILYKTTKGVDVKIDKETLSKGEQQMYASALLKGLVEESEIEFPVFIDSPMQKFDEEHSENIIKNFYPHVSEQVIIFPLINKEMTEKEFNNLLGSISKSFLINNIDSDSSEFIEVEPKQLIKKYNSIYNNAN